MLQGLSQNLSSTPIIGTRTNTAAPTCLSRPSGHFGGMFSCNELQHDHRRLSMLLILEIPYLTTLFADVRFRIKSIRSLSC
jgi:hypothetical protein